MVEFMKQHLLVLAAAVLAAAALIGCAGSGDDRVVGTQDPRILGDWVATQIRLGDETAGCPGTLVVGGEGDEDTISCSDAITTFTAEGKILSGTTSQEYFFSSGNLTVYSNPRLSVEVTFEELDTVMKFRFRQNERTAEVWYARPAVAART